jgi:hypothetical protein
MGACVCIQKKLFRVNFDFSKEESSASVVYNYKHGFSGFAAMLTPEQAKQLAGQQSSSVAMHYVI